MFCATEKPKEDENHEELKSRVDKGEEIENTVVPEDAATSLARVETPENSPPKSEQIALPASDSGAPPKTTTATNEDLEAERANVSRSSNEGKKGQGDMPEEHDGNPTAMAVESASEKTREIESSSKSTLEHDAIADAVLPDLERKPSEETQEVAESESDKRSASATSPDGRTSVQETKDVETETTAIKTSSELATEVNNITEEEDNQAEEKEDVDSLAVKELSRLTVRQLKSRLKRGKQDTSGVKAVLIQRMITSGLYVSSRSKIAAKVTGATTQVRRSSRKRQRVDSEHRPVSAKKKRVSVAPTRTSSRKSRKEGSEEEVRIVLTSHRLSASQEKNLGAFHATLTEDVSDCTHLVVKKGSIARTLKVLFAMSKPKGPHIVHDGWVAESIKLKRKADVSIL